MHLSSHQKAIIALIVANTIWGAAAPIFKWSLEEIGPFTLAFFRFSIATLLVLPFLQKESLTIQKSDYKNIFLLAFTGITINISFFFLGLRLTESINAPIIASSGPIFIMLGSMIFLREHPGLKRFYGGIMGLIGVLIIVLQPILQSGIDGSVIGNVFLILATLGSVHHIILLKKLSTQYKPGVLAFWSFLIGSLTFFPLYFLEISKTGFSITLTQQGLIGILFGSVLSSALAYFMLYWSMKYLLASDAGLFTYLDPIVAILIAIPLLGEVPSTTFILGALLVFGGIYIAEGRIHYHPFHKLRNR